MSRDKQIEEMAKILCGMKNGCDGCMWDKVHCNERNYAEEIYNAGYRKSQDLAEEIFAEIEEKGKVDEPIVEYYILSFSELAELKKKYIGKDTNVPTKESEKDNEKILL